MSSGSVCTNMRANQCNNTKFSRTFGSIYYQPQSENERIIHHCGWEFRPPNTKAFILVLNFEYLYAYDGEDEIILPDGTV